MSDTLAAADLDAYLARLAYGGPLRADVPTLAALHAAHVAAIPFENLDVRWGRGVALDLPSLVAKLVHARRGGYCFEQNGLFAAALRAVGFDVTPLAARVRYGATRVLPRTHLALAVDVDGERFLADTGFGAQTLLAPLPLCAGHEGAQGVWQYRLDEARGTWTLRFAEDGAWTDLYAFTLEPTLPADVEMANWYVSTHPMSRFVQTMTVQRATNDVRHVVRNDEHTEDRGPAGRSARRLDHDALLALVRALGLPLPDGTRLPLP